VRSQLRDLLQALQQWRHPSRSSPMSSVAYKFAHKRVLVIEEVLEQWQTDHEEANIASSIEELVSEVFSAMKSVQSIVDGKKNGIRPGTTTGEISRAHMIGLLLEKSLDQLPKVIDLAEEVRRMGYSIEKLDDLGSLQMELIGIRDAFAKKWLLPDRQKIALAKQELAGGKYRVL
jgi:hypothetical protein